jgi:hypothetical protein
MSMSRKCRACHKGPSANRKGRPGLCTSCIDVHYRNLGCEPLMPYVSPTTPRQCRCITCGHISEFAYRDIRSRTIILCEPCLYSSIYSAGLNGDRGDPTVWRISREEAVRKILGDQFFVRDDSGNVLSCGAVAAQMVEVWSPIVAECIVCAAKQRLSIISVLATANPDPLLACGACLTAPLCAEQDRIFAEYGLVRDRQGYAKLTEQVEAHCVDCGSERRISFSDLTRGVRPCLVCDEGADPNAPYHVYVMHFARLRAFKIGITSTQATSDRLGQHVSQGGTVAQNEIVPNKQAALSTEAEVLRMMRDYSIDFTSDDFPQGGFTEAWRDEAPPFSLKAVIERLHRNGTPGFDRVEKLEAYFADQPIKFAELLPFGKIERMQVDDTVVHKVRFSEPYEQVLRQIRQQRENAALSQPVEGKPSQ